MAIPVQREPFLSMPMEPPPPRATAEGQRLRAFAEAAADWFWETDETLRFSYLSASLDDGDGGFAGAFVGHRVDQLDGPEFVGVDWRPLLRRLELRAPFRNFRFARRDANGVLRHFAVSGVPVFDAAGEFRGYRGTGHDLTQELQAEARAALTQARFIDAIDSIPEGFLLLDAEDRLVLCNSRFRELHAAIAATLVPGASFEAICRASAAAELPASAKGHEEDWVKDRLARHGQPHFAVEEREIAGRWFQVSERRTRDGGTVLVETEITAVKRREQELAEKSALLRATLDNMEQGLLVLDASLAVLIWNEQMLDLLGMPPGLVAVGRTLEELVRHGVAAGEYGPGEVETLVADRLAQIRSPGTHVTEFLRRNGKTVEIRHAPMPDGGLLFTYSDISERKRVEADLRRAKDEAELASRSKSEFLANMSHELRTPLNAIIGFSDILTGEIFGSLGNSRYADYARDIRDSGLHLLNLINDVLDVSKVEFGKVELIEETVDVVAVVESCARLMRERADTAGILLGLDLAPGLPYLQGDSRRLKQVLLNLLSNAVKFTPAGGKVTIGARHDETGMHITVADSGIGIAPEDLDKALRPFGQIDSRLARKYQGTGLGLPLARSMAELHGGRLELASTPGQGTTVTLHLPPARILLPAAATRPAAAAAAEG